jgi:hypothetical protein
MFEKNLIVMEDFVLEKLSELETKLENSCH